MREPSAKPGKCSASECRRNIWWLPLNGRPHPYDDPEGKVSHFATCCAADRFRKKKKVSPPGGQKGGKS